MKQTLLVAVCMLALHTAAIDAVAQCSTLTNVPYLEIQWKDNMTSVFSVGYKLPANNFDYEFDFNDVEQGLSAAQQIRFHNLLTSLLPRTGDPLLSSGHRFDIQMVLCGSDADEWDVTDLVENAAADAIPQLPAFNSSTPDASVSAPFDIIFRAKPSVTGVREAILLISYYDPDESVGIVVPTPDIPNCYYTCATGSTQATGRATTITIKLTANVVAPIPVNSILVVDRSGSMADPAYTMTGSEPKIGALQKAMVVYYNAMDEIDNYGVAKFNSVGTEYIGFPTNRGTAPGIPANLDAGIITDPAKLKPSGSTSIGGGFQVGLGMLPAPAPGAHKDVVIVQTDGIQNTDPDPTTVPFDATKVLVYTVGLGADIQDQKLIDLSGADRFFKVENEMLQNPAGQDLASFYFKINQEAKGLAIITDPTVKINLGSTPVIAFTSTLTSADKAASFFVIEGDNARQLYTTELLNPRGEVITSASNIGGVPVKVIKANDHIIYKVNGAIDSTFIGEWKLRVVPNGKCKENCSVPITFSAAAKSNLKMALSSLSATYLPGSPIAITARLSEMRLGIVGASVVADVKTPDNTIIRGIRLYDDGKGIDQRAGDGLYSAQFTETAVSGTYQIKVRSTVKTLKGEVTTRENVRYVPLQFPNMIGKVHTPCLSCGWIKFLIIFGFVLLIGIILWIIFFKK